MNKYIEILPPELRLKYINLYDFEKYNSSSNIINGITDNEIIYKLLVHALNKENNVFEIFDIFKEVPSNYKEKFLYDIAEREKVLQDSIIDAFNLEEYILEFNIEQRPHIIKDILFKNFKYNYTDKKNDRIPIYKYKNILQTVMEDGI